LPITALNLVVSVSTPDVKVELVFTMSDQVLKGLTVDCHFVMLPVWPLNVNNADVPPEHIVVPPETEPAIGAASTLTVVVEEESVAHVPFFTTALN
jgi:hypothetical protein